MSNDQQFLQADEQEERQSFIGLSDFRSLLFIFKYARESWAGLTWALILIFISSIMAIVSSRFIGNLVEEVFIPKKWEGAWIYISMIVGLEALAILFHWQGRRLLSKHASYTLYNLRKALLNHLCLLPMSFYDRQPQGRIVTRLTHDVEGLEEFFTNSLGRIINAIFVGTTAVYAIFYTNWKVGFAVVLAMVPAFIFIHATRNTIRGLNRSISRHSGMINAQLSEFISGIEVIRALGLEGWSKHVFDKKVNEQENSLLEANSYYAWSRPLVAFLCTLPLVALVGFGGHLVIAGALAIGPFVALVRYTERFTNPIMIIAWEVHIIQKAFANAERISLFLAHEIEDQYFGDQARGHGVKVGHSFKGDVVFDNVSMEYGNGKNALESVSFHIHPGEKIGLVGRTGSGKTTTVALLARLYRYNKGHISIDGQEISLYDRDYLRSQIGYIGQDVIIFHGSLRENLDFSGRKATEDIVKAVKETGLAKTLIHTQRHLLGDRRLENLSDSAFQSLLEMEILENGANLSVGQRQLISITRVLLLAPSILIMDEATANIDPAMEAIIHTAVHRIMEGRTCLLIAHRLNTLSECDRIFVFSDGRLIEQGAESELVAMNGHYAKLKLASANPSTTNPTIPSEKADPTNSTN